MKKIAILVSVLMIMIVNTVNAKGSRNQQNKENKKFEKIMKDFQMEAQKEISHFFYILKQLLKMLQILCFWQKMIFTMD